MGGDEDQRLAHLFELAKGLGNAEAENPDIPAAYTYLAQFVAHDLTFDAQSSLRGLNEVGVARNFRGPALDLDCVYGRGWEDQPYLYSTKVPDKLVLGTNDNYELDLPRNRDDSTDDGSTCVSFLRRRVALIGDPRNDENILIAQLHLQFLRFHNRLIDDGSSLEDAQRLTRWHYQWVVVHDLLSRLCGADVVGSVLGENGTPDLAFFDLGRPLIPIEFALGAFRFGHSMVRPSYRLSRPLHRARGCSPILILNRADGKENSLQGGRELPPNWTIQWDQFVEASDEKPQASMAIDTNLAEPLRWLELPDRDYRYRSLAFRTLLRGWTFRLPSGQDVARRMNLPVLDPASSDPLWLYVLKEAESEGGRKLGPVAARIVAEVVVGMLAADETSFYRRDHDWKPDPAHGPRFGLAELLRHAGAPMTEDDWYAQRVAARVTRRNSLTRRKSSGKCRQRPPPRP